ncbi:hypothetical protein IIY66_01660 [Candidatus Saccharibacteria bacterium]|nr:hypothetical protein [Candidatus Saccharibacteria bacterium]
MKTKTKIKAAIIAGIGLSAPFLANPGVYAASPSISINDGTYDLYVASGSQSSTDGTASYDSSSNMLTLNGFNGDDIVISGLTSLKINLIGDNTLSMNTTDDLNVPRGISASNVELLFGGTGSLTIDQSSVPGFSSSAAAVYAGSITVESATLNIKAPIKTCLSSLNNWITSGAVGSITINSGNLDLACNTAMQSENIVVNGGNTIIDGALSSVATMSKNLTVNDGQLVVNAESINLGSAMTFYGDVEFKGGETNIHGGQYGIDFTNLSGTLGDIGHFAISGGILNIDQVGGGIHIDDANANSYMEFAGGTTTIDAKYRVAEIIYGAENSKNILIGSNMNLFPSNSSVAMEHKDYSGVYEEYIYYLAAEGKAVTKAIITNQNISPAPDDNKDEIIVPDTATDTTSDKQSSTPTKKAPNTGVSTEETNQMISIFSIVPAVVVSVLGLITFLRARKSIKFD